jgi:hypothetical protein
MKTEPFMLVVKIETKSELPIIYLKDENTYSVYRQ